MRKGTKYYYTVQLYLNSNSLLPYKTYEHVNKGCHGNLSGRGGEEFTWNYVSHSSALRKYRELMRIRVKYVQTLSLIRNTI